MSRLISFDYSFGAPSIKSDDPSHDPFELRLRMLCRRGARASDELTKTRLDTKPAPVHPRRVFLMPKGDQLL